MSWQSATVHLDIANAGAVPLPPSESASSIVFASGLEPSLNQCLASPPISTITGMITPTPISQLTLPSRSFVPLSDGNTTRTLSSTAAVRSHSVPLTATSFSSSFMKVIAAAAHPVPRQPTDMTSTLPSDTPTFHRLSAVMPAVAGVAVADVEPVPLTTQARSRSPKRTATTHYAIHSPVGATLWTQLRCQFLSVTTP